ncbi:unnamed protein product [Paramecium pentaurelia]|uniref:tRNA(His) guanylyltransferase n=1 Tax=Paramecium pentaurelia TaxID=43138 RepID=A0A8S1S6Y5_9CILI|nr:unnamed protein product [Paramecium pentaurelia]
MANSKFEYVKQFEQMQNLLPNTYIVVRIDGKGFHKFTKYYDFQKPNDEQGLKLMSFSACIVMETFPDIQIAYGQSDEFSFVLKKDSELYCRRSDKIATCICSTFTSIYTLNFEKFMKKPLKFPYVPIFDARCVCYPDLQNIRDYLSWRQVDCHINNLYNTCFWGLVQKGMNKQEAEKTLAGTNAGDKNELLFSKLQKNYNNEPEIFKKGTTIIRHPTNERINLKVELDVDSKEQQKLNKKQKKKFKYKELNQQELNQLPNQQKEDLQVQEFYLDIIKDNFWIENKTYILL